MRALPFLLLSVVFVSLASAQESLFVREHNLTYFLDVESFYVEESMVFEKPGEPFTFEEELYFLRGDAEDVKVTGYPFSVPQTSPRKIILEFLISTGQKKRVTLKYRRSDLITEKDGVYIFKGLALGYYPWIVNSARIEFKVPEGYQFGRYSPSTGFLRVDDGSSLIFKLSLLENASALLAGFPVEIEYADYKSLAAREIELTRMLISDAEFEVGIGNITVEKLFETGENIALYQSTYALSKAAFQDAKRNYQNALVYRGDKKYYEAYSSAKMAGTLARLAIDEARKLRAAEAMLSSFQKSGGEAVERGLNKSVPLEKLITDEAVVERPSRYLITILFAVALLVVAAFLIVSRKPVIQKIRSPGIEGLGLTKRASPGFEEEVERIKKRKALASRIRDLMNRRKSKEMELERFRKSLAAGRMTEKEYTRRRYNLLRSIGRIDSEVTKLEAELERIKKEEHD